MREGREQDAAELRALLAIATEDQIRAAREALRRIEERGFHRGKRLLAELEAFL